MEMPKLRLPLSAQRLKAAPAQAWAAVGRSAARFRDIDGDQWAAAFSYSAFFSLFPLVILFVTWASLLFDKGAASALIIGFVGKYLPMSGDMKDYVFATISGVIGARGQAGTVAFVMLLWVATQCFNTLIIVTNKAWGTLGRHWWKLPLKSLALMVVISLAIMTGLWLPMFEQIAVQLLPKFGFIPKAYGFGTALVPWALIFLSLTLFYRVAPHRRIKFHDVWNAAFWGTLLLAGAQRLFLFYLAHFATFNAVYGAFGGIIALLLWIYLSGCVLIFCACLSATSYETAHRSDAPR